MAMVRLQGLRSAHSRSAALRDRPASSSRAAPHSSCRPASAAGVSRSSSKLTQMGQGAASPPQAANGCLPAAVLGHGVAHTYLTCSKTSRTESTTVDGCQTECNARYSIRSGRLLLTSDARNLLIRVVKLRRSAGMVTDRRRGVLPAGGDCLNRLEEIDARGRLEHV